MAQYFAFGDKQSLERTYRTVKYVERSMRNTPRWPTPNKMPGGGTVTGGAIDIQFVLIDDDIDPVVEDDPPTYEYSVTGTQLEDPEDTPVGTLNLWGFEVTEVELKLFDESGTGDRGFSRYELGLENLGTDTGTTGTSDRFTYDTVTATWIDGKAFKVGKYNRSDYPDYDENAPWPPSAVDDPDTFFKKRYRGIVVNGILFRETCRELPPPELPEDL